ncbi:hypothetical protein [Neokomagataea thailandica]|uniref:SHOCT domain-containing protein n=1 Tax=Neokomagataea tanensis NBRC 106556 TaxID=1223519 RepID=A0ABQ0QLB1_9PROT|nr:MULTISPECIES: hypothetical protein [Neokomagataea]GBR49148.1 hypothetical protein AA106556_1948 [Neokomagataea tanensis NBRC 106556]
MRQNTDKTLENLEKLFELKERKIISEDEYYLKKFQLLNKDTELSEKNNNKRLGHGVSLLIGAIACLLIEGSILSPDNITKEILNQSLGMIIIFGAWIIPHSIWLITKKGANIILPIISLAIIGLCLLSYIGNAS